MHAYGEEKGHLKCSFCGKSSDQVNKLIAGPDVYICDQCVAACQALVNERKAQDKNQSDKE